MRNQRPDSNEFDFQLEPDGYTARRRTRFLPDGAYLFEDEIKAKGTFSLTIITGAAWLVELFELKSGELFFLRGEERVSPNAKRFGIFYPPFTITRPCFRDAKGYVMGIADDEPSPAKSLTAPVLFETNFTGRLAGVAQVKEILASGSNRQSVEAHPSVSLLSLKAKRLIDENHRAHPSIARIAARLGVSHEHLSRQFKRDFNLSPSRYLHQLRLAEATFGLAKGEEIINISQEVGYNDLSRFYKQFRKATKTSPGSCRTTIKPRSTNRS